MPYCQTMVREYKHLPSQGPTRNRAGRIPPQPLRNNRLCTLVGMPVSFDVPSETGISATANTPPDAEKSTPRTTQFFADRTRTVLVGDQGGIGRWGRSGDLNSALSQEAKEQPSETGNLNALAMRFRAVHKGQASACSEAPQVWGSHAF